MCILLKLHYGNFNVSKLFCSKVIEEKPLGGRAPLVKEGLIICQFLKKDLVTVSCLYRIDR